MWFYTLELQIAVDHPEALQNFLVVLAEVHCAWYLDQV